MTKARNRTPALKLVPGQRMTPETVSRPQGAAPSLESRRDLDWSICMARAQDGDKEAYRRLLEDIVPYLRKLALRYLRDRADIEDAVQDVLVTVHAVRQTYDPARPFGPWLTAIANRRIVDQVRRRGRTACESPLEPEQETFAASETNLQEGEAEARLLREAVDRLPPGQRQAVQLLKLQEMSLKDAAAASGMSIAALKVATHRALKSLRRMLAGQGDTK